MTITLAVTLSSVSVSECGHRPVIASCGRLADAGREIVLDALLMADMPGVDKDRLNLHVENDSLIVEGEAGINMPEGMDALYADVQVTRYRSSFALSGELETDGIDASLKDGVLRVRIPKRAEVLPRKIEVRVE